LAIRSQRKVTNYQRGYKVELSAKKRLEKDPMVIVIRSSRSLTLADLIAIFPDKAEIWLIQCKKEQIPNNPIKYFNRFREFKSLDGTYTLKTFLYAKKNGRYQFIKL